MTPVQLVDRCARGCRGNLPGADGCVRLCAAQDRVDPGVHGMARDGDPIDEVMWQNAALVERRRRSCHRSASRRCGCRAQCQSLRASSDPGGRAGCRGARVALRASAVSHACVQRRCRSRFHVREQGRAVMFGIRLGRVPDARYLRLRARPLRPKYDGDARRRPRILTPSWRRRMPRETHRLACHGRSPAPSPDESP